MSKTCDDEDRPNFFLLNLYSLVVAVLIIIIITGRKKVSPLFPMTNYELVSVIYDKVRSLICSCVCVCECMYFYI